MTASLHRIRYWIGSVSMLCVLAFFGSAGGQGSEGTRSELIYPPQQIPLNFSHQRHIEQGVQCLFCHDGVGDSQETRDRNLPGHETCGVCHLMQVPNAEKLYPPAACSTCHTDFSEGSHADLGAGNVPLPDKPAPPAVVVPAARITFSHERHLDEGVPCLTCHQGVPSTDLATREHLPEMSTCLDCHNGGKAPGECTTCHLQGDGGRVLTQFEEDGLLFPAGRFRPDDHQDGRWLQVHQFAARVDEGSCSACHEAADCLECHDGVVKPEGLHPADWVMTHGLEAQRRTLDCQACHETETDCQECHRNAEVVRGPFPGGPGSDQEGLLRFHPEGWAGVVGEIPGADHHSHVARRSLETCEACHGGEDEALCLDCHGTLVSPHPKSWGEEGAAGNFGQGEGSVCYRCHLPGDSQLNGLRR